MKTVSPSIAQTAFSCPSCGALTTQSWFKVYAEPFAQNGMPSLWTQEGVERVKQAPKKADGVTPEVIEIWQKLAQGTLFLASSTSGNYGYWAGNLHISKCFNCHNLGVWHYDKMIWPNTYEGPKPNPDMPVDVRRDYEEAAAIAKYSPRGAAALLRLAIQKLCGHLGGKGKNINDDIAELVANGLPKQVQQALDIVRVVGNNAVHPGEIKTDDSAVADQLFKLTNIIVEQMITGPRHIEEMFSSLPEGAKSAIIRRDGS